MKQAEVSKTPDFAFYDSRRAAASLQPVEAGAFGPIELDHAGGPRRAGAYRFSLRHRVVGLMPRISAARVLLPSVA